MKLAVVKTTKLRKIRITSGRPFSNIAQCMAASFKTVFLIYQIISNLKIANEMSKEVAPS